LALAALALVGFGAYDSYPILKVSSSASRAAPAKPNGTVSDSHKKALDLNSKNETSGIGWSYLFRV